MITTAHSTDAWKRGRTSLLWDGKTLEKIKLQTPNGASATIDLHMGLEPNSLGGGASKCNQAEFAALEHARMQIKKSILHRSEMPDIQAMLEKAGWEIFPG